MKCANQSALVLRSMERPWSWYKPHLSYIHRIYMHSDPSGIKQRIHSWLSHGADSSFSLHPGYHPSSRLYKPPAVEQSTNPPLPCFLNLQLCSFVNSTIASSTYHITQHASPPFTSDPRCRTERRYPHPLITRGQGTFGSKYGSAKFTSVCSADFPVCLWINI